MRIKISFGNLDILYATIVFFSALTGLAFTANSIGITWDEPLHIIASEIQIDWFKILMLDPARALQTETINQYWLISREHPPLVKIWSGLIWKVLRHFSSDIFAHRFGNILISSFLFSYLYFKITVLFNRRVAILTVVGLFSMPRFFCHSQLVTLDVPSTLMYFVILIYFWEHRHLSKFRHTIGLGILLGIGIAVKSTTFLSVIPIFLWHIIFDRRLVKFFRLSLSVIVSLVFFVVVWPLNYADFPQNLLEHLFFLSSSHAKIPQWYLDELYLPPPWHFPLLLSFAVIPLSIFLLAIVGGVKAPKSNLNSRFLIFLTLALLAPIVVISTGIFTVYDNERLIMPSFPFVAIFAGFGFDQIWSKFHHRLGIMKYKSIRKLTLACVLVLLVSPQIYLGSAHFPYLLSYYSFSIGGSQGANYVGLETTYWSETYSTAAKVLNDRARRNSSVWVQYMSQPPLFYLKSKGLLRKDIEILDYDLRNPNIRIDVNCADYAILQYRQSGFTNLDIEKLRQNKLLFRLSKFDLPLMDIYEISQSNRKKNCHPN